MRTVNRSKVQPAGGVQLWTIPVAVLAVMMAVSLVRSVAEPGGGQVRSRLVAPIEATVDAVPASGFQQASNGEGGGSRSGQGPAAADERPAKRVRD